MATITWAKSVFIHRNVELPQETSSATCFNVSMYTLHRIFVLNNQRFSRISIEISITRAAD